MERKKIKAYIIYGGSEGFYTASLVLENGWAPFSHICSSPGFMATDLLIRRRERVAVFEAMGFDIQVVGLPIAGSNSPHVPAGLLEKHQNETNWRGFADEYRRVRAELFPNQEQQS